MTYDIAQRVNIGDQVIAGDTGLYAKVIAKNPTTLWTNYTQQPIVEFDIYYECLDEQETVNNLELYDVV